MSEGRILKMELEPSTRIVWASERARQTWDKALQDAATAVSRLELESVAAGQRPCSWQTMDERAHPAWAAEQARRGLITVAVRRSLAFNGFAHRFQEPQDGKPAAVSTIVARRMEDAQRFLAAFQAGDHETQGELLGFPICCRQAFSRNWAAGIHDPVWEAAMETPHERDGNTIRLADAPALSNPLLRYIGPRPGFHIPHSFNCHETEAAAERRLELTDRPTATIIKALLAMPMSWDSWHGLAVVRTPIFYIVTTTTPRAERMIIEKAGSFIPAEMPAGAVFPFNLKG